LSSSAIRGSAATGVSQKAADVHLLDHKIEMGPVLTCESTRLPSPPSRSPAEQRRHNNHELMHQAPSKHWGGRSGLALSRRGENRLFHENPSGRGEPRGTIPLTAMASFKLSSFLRQALPYGPAGAGLLKSPITQKSVGYTLRPTTGVGLLAIPKGTLFTHQDRPTLRNLSGVCHTPLRGRDLPTPKGDRGQVDLMPAKRLGYIGLSPPYSLTERPF